MKKLEIACDVCKEPCRTNEFSSFFYGELSFLGHQVNKTVIEQNYCIKHTDQIKDFIKQIK